MNDKTIIDRIDVSECGHYGKCSTYCYVVDEPCSDNSNCYYKQLARKEQELKNICKAFDIEYLIDKETGNLIGRCNKLYKKEQECEALQMSENEAGEIIAELQAYKDINEDFKTAWEELKAENEELKRKITKIFACLIKANRTNKIVDTLWVDNITTLWDYITLTLGIEGDQTQVEEQILQKIREVENDNK